jgi:hypothetical protein
VGHGVELPGKVEPVRDIRFDELEAGRTDQVADVLQRPVDRLSMQTSESPRASTASHRCEPKKPAPPVTSTLMSSLCRSWAGKAIPDLAGMLAD